MSRYFRRRALWNGGRFRLCRASGVTAELLVMNAVEPGLLEQARYVIIAFSVPGHWDIPPRAPRSKLVRVRESKPQNVVTALGISDLPQYELGVRAELV